MLSNTSLESFKRSHSPNFTVNSNFKSLQVAAAQCIQTWYRARRKMRLVARESTTSDVELSAVLERRRKRAEAIRQAVVQEMHSQSDAFCETRVESHSSSLPLMEKNDNRAKEKVDRILDFLKETMDASTEENTYALSSDLFRIM